MDCLFSKCAYDCDSLYGIAPITNELPYIHENENDIMGRKIYYISVLHVEFKEKKDLKI